MCNACSHLFPRYRFWRLFAHQGTDFGLQGGIGYWFELLHFLSVYRGSILLLSLRFFFIFHCLRNNFFLWDSLSDSSCKYNLERQFKTLSMIFKIVAELTIIRIPDIQRQEGSRINGGASARELISRRRSGGRGVHDSSRPAIICTRPIGHVIWIFEMVVLPVRQAGRLPSSRYWDGFNSHRAACTRLIWPHLRRGTKIPVNWP